VTTPAERRLRDATNRLLEFERHVLRGLPYDEGVFAQAVDAFCRAIAAAAREKTAARTGPATPPAAETETVSPLAPTPQLLFARWLAQRGRLSG
jgi:hypothetical protein